MIPHPPRSALSPSSTLFRSRRRHGAHKVARLPGRAWLRASAQDRKSTRLNSSHVRISYAVFCLKKKRFDSQHLHLQRPDQVRKPLARGFVLSATSYSDDIAMYIACRKCDWRPDVWFFFLWTRRPPRSTLFPYTTFFR